MNAHTIFYADSAKPVHSTHPAAMLAKEAARRVRNATSLQETLAGYDFGNAAMAEAKVRTFKVLDRVLPDLPTVNGYHNPHGFLAASKRRAERSIRYKDLNERMLWKIIARDGLLSGEAA